MSKLYLLVVAVGPVQSFIAAARRTRDLWYGSVLLSKLSEAAANSVAELTGSRLIFPATRGQGEEYGAVANKIVALVLTDDISNVAVAAKCSALKRYRALSEDCLETLGQKQQGVDVNLFRGQLDHTLELYAAWVEVHEADGVIVDYVPAYCRVNAILEGRKQLRNFRPNPTAHAGALLSSLDGERESVISTNQLEAKRLRRRMGIDATEELDSVGLIKRVLGRRGGFLSLTRVALQRWIEGIGDEPLAELSVRMEALRNVGLASCSQLLPRVCTKAGSVENPGARFPYDCEMLLPSRRKEMRRKASDLALSNDTTDVKIVAALDDLERLLAQQKAYAGLPTDSLYYALLIADGDRMGRLLSDERNCDASHVCISSALEDFAAQAPLVVARHGGVCVYAGGDDVVALLPLDGAINCSRMLADEFGRIMASAAPAGIAPPTLSVGLAFVHVLEPLGDSRQAAKRAQHLAKEGIDKTDLRNALGVIVKPRNGAEVAICGRWNEPAPAGERCGFDQRIQRWVACFKRQRLARSAAYDLNELAKALPEEALATEAVRLFERRGADDELLSDIKHELEQPAAGSTGENPHQRLANEWYVARWLTLNRVAAPPAEPPSAGGVLIDNGLIGEHAR